MIIILSPAKTIDFENARIVSKYSFPEFINEANMLSNELKKLHKDDLIRLMNISSNIANLNFNRYKNWNEKQTKNNLRQAICSFKGEAYNGLNVTNWNDEDFNFAQNNLRILSGIYGILRPLDYIQPYRLEMGTKFDINGHNNLYKFWGNKITNSIQQQLDCQNDNTLINLASNEYFKSINKKKLNAQIITPLFKDFKNSEYKTLATYAKKARGEMSSYIIKNKITQLEKLKEYNKNGYSYNDRLTKGDEWVYTRE